MSFFEFIREGIADIIQTGLDLVQRGIDLIRPGRDFEGGERGYRGTGDTPYDYEPIGLGWFDDGADDYWDYIKELVSP